MEVIKRSCKDLKIETELASNGHLLFNARDVACRHGQASMGAWTEQEYTFAQTKEGVFRGRTWYLTPYGLEDFLMNKEEPSKDWILLKRRLRTYMKYLPEDVSSGATSVAPPVQPLVPDDKTRILKIQEQALVDSQQMFEKEIAKWKKLLEENQAQLAQVRAQLAEH
jgi:hypothetical protein